MQIANTVAQSSIKFVVSNSAKQCGVVHPVVCVITNVKRAERLTVYDKHIETVMENISEIREKMLPSQEVQGFRELYKAVGSEVLPAGEKLLHTCTNRSFPKYNNLVDAYNLIALKNITPIGAHDAKKLIESKGPLLFRLAEGDEKIMPSFKKEEVKIPKGDFTYGIKVEGMFVPFAWLGQQDTDSEHYRINKKTKAILVTMIGNQYTSLERNKQLCQDIFDLIKLSCPQAEMEILYPEFVD